AMKLFESTLPFFPHQYLENLLQADAIGADSDPVEEAGLRLSVIRYYAEMQEMPEGSSKALRWIKDRVLEDLSSKGPEEWEVSFVFDDVPVLEWLTSHSTSPEAEQLADVVLLRYVRQKDHM